MSSASVAISSNCNKNCTFQDDSLLPICLSALPGVGLIVQVCKEFSLVKGLREAALDDNKDQFVKLVETRNKYTYASIARQILTSIAMITMVALAVLNPIGGAILATVFLIFAGLNIYRIHNNVTHIINPHKGGQPFDVMRLK